ncbi:ABC transporter permease [Streptomyces radicis]|uniref:ABC transporter permease n=1 Tax=Streptomyces radicis TaxID=1750517 RepID=A0A3A9W5D8_9ACTN|nr:ABC transporter permease [Streptomyces radicis]RKN08368.1 ABC transporter permease [Streptomyces radicis]RKN21597.1 ABC transporter permease [Streptomyces radicis]
MTNGAPSLVSVSPTLGVVLCLLLIAAATVAALWRLTPGAGTGRGAGGGAHGGVDDAPGAWRAMLIAGARAALQLSLVSLVITWAVTSAAGVLAFVAVMFAVAVRTAGRRLTANRTGWLTAAPIAGSVAPVVAVFLLTGLVPPEGLSLIPVTGILIGGALTATVLAGRRALDELAARRGEVEAALALGFLVRDARWEVARPAASEALVPGLDQTRTVGLVTLPGAFVGMLLAGASPLMAGAAQLFVLIALMAVQTVAVAVTTELITRRLLHREGPSGT